MDDELRLVAFAGARLLAEGPPGDVLPVLKHRFDNDRSDSVLVFNANSGQQTDFDLTVPLHTLIERVAGGGQRGPGRPKLGVTSREVTLLPRHWHWLESQPNGISATIRRLVEYEMKRDAGGERARGIRASLNHILSAIAGDRPNFEEATRALFADDLSRFEALVGRWPRDIRMYAVRRAIEAHEAQTREVPASSGGDK